MTEEEPRMKRWERVIRRELRHLERRLPRDWKPATKGLVGSIVIALILGVSALYLQAYWSEIRLDWNTIISIMLADIPVGLVLWVILQRRESKEHRLLDAAEIVELPLKFAHLEIHYSDIVFADFEYPDKHYYVVNTRSKGGLLG